MSQNRVIELDAAYDYVSLCLETMEAPYPFGWSTLLGNMRRHLIPSIRYFRIEWLVVK